MTRFTLARPTGLILQGSSTQSGTPVPGGAAVTASFSGAASAYTTQAAQYTITLSANATVPYTVTWGVTGGASLSSPTSVIGIGQRTASVNVTWATPTSGSVSASLTPSVTVAGSPLSVTVLTLPVSTFTGTYRPYLVHPRSKGNIPGDPYGGASGPDRRTFSSHIQTKWEFLGGDFIDKNGVKYNGANDASLVPWTQFTIPVAGPPGSIDVPLTELTAHWLDSGHNRGATFLSDSTSNNSAWVVFTGTMSPTPPILIVTTTTGVQEFIGDLAGWATGSDSGDDSRLRRRMSRIQRCIIQFELLPDVTGTLISAVMRLTLDSKDDVFPLTIKVFETDAPPLLLGRAGKPVVLGLADEVGEMAIQGSPWTTPSPHADVWGAGDFKKRNIWNAYYDRDSATAALPSRPADLFNAVSIKQNVRDEISFLVDNVHVPGTTEYQGALITTQIGGGEIKFTIPESMPNTADPLRGTRPECPKEVFVRQYIYFEESFVSGDSDQFGFKMGLGLDAQFGLGGASGLGWSEAAGSGQSDSYGCRFKWWSYPSTGPDPLTLGATEGDVWYQYDLGNTANVRYKLTNGVWVRSGRYLYAKDAGVPNDSVRWCYEGHSFRAHSGGFMGTTNTKYPNVIALNSACSHLGNPPSTVSPIKKGSYDSWDSGVYGTEQTLRIGTGPHDKFAHVFEIQKWYCVEAQLKMNTVDMSAPDANGNGRANNDGILRYWIDGAMVGERTTMAWTNTPDMGIEGSYFIMYHGGVAGPDDPITGLPVGYPNDIMRYRLNNFAIAKRYIGPHVTRNYPAGVKPPSDPPVTGGSLATFAASIGLAAAAPNTWIDTQIKPDGCWAVKSMVDGGRYATKEELEPGPADVGNFGAIAEDTLVNSNGAAWFPLRNQFFWRGGGHGGWMGTEVYWMDVATMKMGRMTNPAGLLRDPDSSSGYGWKTVDGSPISYHTYNGIVAVEELDCFFTLFGSPWPDGGTPNSDMWRFDLKTKAWTKVFSNVFAPFDEKIGPCAHWIPSLQRIACGQPNYWRLFNPFNNTVGPMITGSLMSFGNSVSTPDAIYAFGRVGTGSSAGVTIHRIAHSAIGVSAPVSQSGLCPRIYAHPRFRDACFEWNSFFWDVNRNMVISWSASYNSEPSTGRVNVGKFVYGIDFANDHLYEFVVPTNFFAKSQALGAYTKWQHILELDCYIGCNNRMRGDPGNSIGWMTFKPGTPTRLT